MNFKKVISTALMTGIFLATAGVSFADGSPSNCQIVYGGGQVCQQQIKFTIDKKVLQPTKGGTFVDNLTVSDAHFAAGNDVGFKIVITNTGNQTINQLTVVDTLPSYMTFISGVGTYNSSNNTITYTVSNLAAGATNEQSFAARIVDQKNLPQNQNVVCMTNAVTANDNMGDTASDTASLCADNNMPTPTPQIFTTVPVKTIPNTGPEMLPMLGLIPAGLAGFALRKKSKLN